MAAAGFVLVVVGILIIPVPGPWSLPVILTGLVLLALEFDWAERFLATTIRRTDAAKDAAVEASPTKKALGVLVFGLAVAAMVVAVMRWDVPFLPV